MHEGPILAHIKIYESCRHDPEMEHLDSRNQVVEAYKLRHGEYHAKRHFERQLAWRPICP